MHLDNLSSKLENQVLTPNLWVKKQEIGECVRLGRATPTKAVAAVRLIQPSVAIRSARSSLRRGERPTAGSDEGS
jgi:hypothetical protein